MRKYSQAFTLIELLVGITISMILMLSVGVFIGSGMQNIFNQQTNLKNSSDFSHFAIQLQEILSLYNTGTILSINNTGSGIVLQRNQQFDTGGFSYIGPITLTGAYCKSEDLDESDEVTQHLLIKNNITFTGSTSGIYTSDPVNHVIYKNTDEILIGKGVFGNNLTEGGNGASTYLNTPTGLALSGSTHLFISDTLNNRILSYNLTNDTIYTLLDENDGINQPGKLDLSGGRLQIVNSGKGEVLELSSGSTPTTPLTLSFSGSANMNNITRYTIDFLTGSHLEITDSDLFNSLGTYIHYDNNTLSNYYTRYTGSDQNIPGCISNTYLYNSGVPVRCTNTNTGITSTPDGQDFTTDQSISITGIDLSGVENGPQYVKLSLFDNTTEVFSKYFPYFIQSDNDLNTQGDNTLSILESGKFFPQNIAGDEYDMLSYDTSDISYNSETDILLPIPIKSFSVTESGGLIHFDLDYYSKYYCYNTDDNIVKKFIMKKNIK